MSHYKRVYISGGCYFFTLVTYQRKPILTGEARLNRLREAFHHVMKKRPFSLDAIVILPDHLHAIWTLPENDCDFSIRWRLIKDYFSKGVKKSGYVNKIWQPRFWEHSIRDENDLRRHLDYIHFNPVKHGFVESAWDWEAGSFRRYVKKRVYDRQWGAQLSDAVRNMDLE